VNFACTIYDQDINHHILKFRRNDPKKHRDVSSEGGSPKNSNKLMLQYKKLRKEAKSLKRELDGYAYKRDQAFYLGSCLSNI
jgi:hypothetical protein